MEQNTFVSSEMKVQDVPTKDSAACSPESLGDVAGNKPKKKRKCHKCIVCFKEFKRSTDLKDHISVHTGVPCARLRRKRELRHKCMVCEKMLRSPFALKDHMNVHTGVCNYVCKICGKKFFQRTSLEFHSTTHSTDRPYKCKFCTSTFKRPDNLTRHVFFIHEKKRRIKCSDCNRYYFPYEGSEERHAKKYHVGEDYKIDEKPFKCKLCDAEFVQDWFLRAHVDTVHSDKRPYLCAVCGKSYKTSGALQIHSALHKEAEEVRIECKICRKMVKEKSMYMHMKYHDEKRFLCNFCGKRFFFKHQVTTHEKSSHLGLKAHACDQCDKRFALPHHLRAHKKTHLRPKKQK